MCPFRASLKRIADATYLWVACYAALERLWRPRDWFHSSLGDPTPERGGKARKRAISRVTGAGLHQSPRNPQGFVQTFWRALPATKENADEAL